MKKNPKCDGHPAGPFDPMGETVYCDGSCKPKPAKKPAKLSKKKLAAHITAFYGANSVDMSINVLDIGKVFRMAEDAYATAGTLEAVEAAVKEAVAKYCVHNSAL